MCYSEVQPIALAILTSIITGGFVLVFVEIGNRKNRENDKHDQIMAPFMGLGSLMEFSGQMTTDYTVYGKEAIANMFCEIVENYNKLNT